MGMMGSKISKIKNNLQMQFFLKHERLLHGLLHKNRDDKTWAQFHGSAYSWCRQSALCLQAENGDRNTEFGGKRKSLINILFQPCYVYLPDSHVGPVHGALQEQVKALALSIHKPPF